MYYGPLQTLAVYRALRSAGFARRVAWHCARVGVQEVFLVEVDDEGNEVPGTRETYR